MTCTIETKERVVSEKSNEVRPKRKMVRGDFGTNAPNGYQSIDTSEI